MAKQITKTVYSYKELKELQAAGKVSSAALEKATAWLQEGATDYEWWDSTYETWQTALAQVGFDNAVINFSGFSSQGGGASFTADVDLDKLIEFLAHPPEPKDCIEGEPEDFRPWIVHKCNGVKSNPKFTRILKVREFIRDLAVERTNHRYSHERSCNFSASLNDNGDWISGATFAESRWESHTPRLTALFDEFHEAAEQLRLDLSQAIYRELEEEYNYRTSDESISEDADANDYTFTINGTREG